MYNGCIEESFDRDGDIIYYSGEDIEDSFEIYNNSDEEEDEMKPYEKHKFIKLDKITKNLREKYKEEFYNIDKKIEFLNQEYLEKLNEFKNYENMYVSQKDKLILKRKNIDIQIKNKVKNIEQSYNTYTNLIDKFLEFKLPRDSRLLLFRKLEQYYEEREYDFEIKLLPDIKKIFDYIIENNIFEENRKELELVIFKYKKLNKIDFIHKTHIYSSSYYPNIIYYKYIPKNTKIYLNLNDFKNYNFHQNIYSKLITLEDVNVNLFYSNGENFNSKIYTKEDIFYLNNMYIESDKDVCVVVFYQKYR